ncbi:uracil-DNA glycosylase family protein [Ferrimonas senticii]|uniref:uracil-DNA glycosylase family protein n=1 Tax=Ferrimonas senticii TaxID=394566 RepID=UPI000421A4EB|nr:uracil-DNA glycosylase family protein [Ferrimonas senticii]
MNLDPRRCTLCHDKLEPKPLLQFSASAKILIIGQAPGRKAHQSGIPFADASGQRLRQWLGLSDDQFYDPALVAIMPMGLCYPGTGRSGDNPPDKRCAPLWHPRLLPQLQQLQLTLLLGQYAQRRYLPAFVNTTSAVTDWQQTLRHKQIALPHPSPRNNRWLKQHLWFEQQLLPVLQQRIAAIVQAQKSPSNGSG